MSQTDVVRENNDEFAARRGYEGAAIYPWQNICVITCLDPRTDPAGFMGLGLGAAATLRNAGGRVTSAMLADLALISFLSERQLKPGEPIFEVMVVHHNQCGTHFLADDAFRHELMQRAGGDEEDWIAEAVVHPEETVEKDVAAILADTGLSRRMTVSGHVYDVTTGILRMVVPTAPMPSL
ncbi:carbonic anhydrase [Naasia lichenicola]|uniref:carbonic anhydrase n=1 Tax=Naasia lichenicola TaxID=2565933 RepID=A0A4S4FRB0_9MICO|nr:carbonic anhydrase [Naasia lichenicola]THG32851.1 carbonic anhydrase [Naasia lichenicola]